MERLNRERNTRRREVVNYDEDFSGGYGKNFGADYDEDRGFFDDDSSWGRSNKMKSGVGRNDYGNNDVLRRHEDMGYFGKGPKGWKRTDERIREDACEALYRDHQIDASDIDLMVKEGCVYLKGTVDSRRAKKEVERVIETILGVADVQNELRVRQEGEAAPVEDPAQIDQDRDQQDSNTFS